MQRLSLITSQFFVCFYSLLSASKHGEISQVKENTSENTLAFISEDTTLNSTFRATEESAFLNH